MTLAAAPRRSPGAARLARCSASLATLVLAGLLSACAMLNPSAKQPAAAASDKPAAVRVEINAPADLKLLLERHLDLLRLGRISRDDVDDSEWQRLIDATPAQVRDLLKTEGYFQPDIKLQRVAATAEGTAGVVRLNVLPGARARIGRIDIEIEGELPSAAAAGDADAQAALQQLRSRWALPVGSEFRNPTWADAKTNTLVRLQAAGFARAAWSGTSAVIDVPTQTVRLFLVMDSGPLFRLGELNVEGLAAHDVQTVRNLANSKPGVPVTDTLLLDFQDRLQKANLFESVSVTLDTEPTRAQNAQVLVRLREAPLEVYTFGLGVSANTGARASVEHQWRRVFGWAATAHNKIEWGTKRQAWEGDIIAHPGAGLYRNLVGGAVERLQTSSDTVLSQRLRLGRTQDAQRIERLFFGELERSVRTVPNIKPSSTLAASGNFHGGWRDLDSVVLPTRGATLALQMTLGRSNGTDAPTGNFSRSYGRLTGYLPLGGNWYGQARIELGQVALQRGVLVPQTKLFRVGGDDSVRGYDFRSLGPVVNGVVGGGESMMTASVELARPLSAALPAVWGAVFVDAGNAADGFKQIKPVYGPGVGVRWRSPVGPLRVDLAYGTQTRRARLHFSVGIAF